MAAGCLESRVIVKGVMCIHRWNEMFFCVSSVCGTK